MTNYKIVITDPSVLDWINNNANKGDGTLTNGVYSFTINHPDSTDENNFQSELSKRLGVSVNDIPTNLGKYLDEIKTDAVLYINEFLPTAGLVKTNVGTTFTNLYTDFGGRPFFADLTGYTRMAFQTLWSKVGTGAQHIQFIDDSGTITSDLINTETLGGGTGLTTGTNDLANYTIPAPYVNFKGKLRIQVRSTVAADDPIYFGSRIYLRR